MSLAQTMTQPQKAAAILVAMGKPAASRLLKFFKQEELRALVEGARLLRTIPQSELEKIVAEFEAEFTEGAGLVNSAEGMDTIMNESFSAEEMDVLMGKTAPPAEDGPPPVWPQVEKLEPTRLAGFLAQEHPQTAAMVLSNLNTAAAAGIIPVLPKTVRGEVVKRMMAIAAVSPAATRIVENQLRTRLLADSASRDTSAGQSRVANLLNELDKAELDEIMQELEEAGAPDLDAIRSRLFTFEDIVLLPQRARVTLFDGMAAELITLALRNAPATLGEAILSAIGARTRRMIESELAQGSDAIAPAEIVKARKTVAAAAIRLSREGAFALPTMQSAA